MAQQMYDVCINKGNCTQADSDHHYPMGQSVCTECGATLETVDPQISLTSLFHKVTGSIFGKPPAVARAASIAAATQTVVANLQVTIILVDPEPINPQILLAFDFTEDGYVHPVVPESPLVGPIGNGSLTIGASKPYADRRPGIDFSPIAAFPPHVGENGQHIPVAVSGFSGEVRWEVDHFVLVAGTGQNRPKVVDQATWTAPHSMDPGTEIVLESGAIVYFGDIACKFEHTA